jgi:hypothetical protein
LFFRRGPRPSIVGVRSAVRHWAQGLETYIETALIFLGAQRHDREEGRRGLENVMSSQVLGSSTQRHADMRLVSAGDGGLDWNTYLDSNTCRPTLDHLPTGSNVTPRLTGRN